MLARRINQIKEFPEFGVRKDSADSIEHLLQVETVNLLHKIIKSDPTRNKYGCLPKMATASKVSIGVWLASSFRERSNQVINQVVTEENTLLETDEINTLTTLQMSSDFIKFVRKSYGHLSLSNLEGFQKTKKK